MEAKNVESGHTWNKRYSKRKMGGGGKGKDTEQRNPR